MMIIRESARRCCSRLKNPELKKFIQNLHGCGAGISYNNTIPTLPQTTRSYFTNTDEMKRSDPYAALGLTWGATATDIKDAYRRLARELHPDVSQLEPSLALDKFRAVKEAYDKLMNNKKLGTHRTDLWEEWSFAIWRSGDLIAQERTDVAGAMRKRPAKPADSMRRKWGVASLGHPDGRGAAVGRGEYLTNGEGQAKRSSTVGTGQNKWVQKKEFRPWNPEEGSLKGVSQYRKNGNVIGKVLKSDKDPDS